MRPLAIHCRCYTESRPRKRRVNSERISEPTGKRGHRGTFSDVLERRFCDEDQTSAENVTIRRFNTDRALEGSQEMVRASYLLLFCQPWRWEKRFSEPLLDDPYDFRSSVAHLEYSLLNRNRCGPSGAPLPAITQGPVPPRPRSTSPPSAKARTSEEVKGQASETEEFGALQSESGATLGISAREFPSIHPGSK